MDDFEARIMKPDDPHDEIYKMLTADGPEADYIRDVYNDTHQLIEDYHGRR